MDMNQYIEGNLKAEFLNDYPNSEATLTIRDVRLEEMRDPRPGAAENAKVVNPKVFFEELGSRGWVLGNKRREELVQLFGTAETDDWLGQQIKLYQVDTNKGPGIRARLP